MRFVFIPMLFLVCGVAPAQQSSCGNPRGEGITVVVFLADDCPISQKYVPTLNDVYRKYRHKNVELLSLLPGDISRQRVRKFARGFRIRFPIETDKNYDCARATAARVTPEVFVYDSTNTLRYRGAIDNWFYDLGGYRQNATENYLVDTIDALLTGSPLPFTESEAIGCPINIREKTR